MLNKFILFLIAFLAIGWWAEEHVDFKRMKQDAMNVMSQEKTIKTINSSREARQEELEDISNRR